MERVLNGRYRVGPKIGDGGMAMVYRGYDTLLGRSVAIKVLRDQYAADPQFLARFEREAQAVAALTHPNIINIFDVGVDTAGGDACHYFVMEFIDGPNLKEIIRARGPLPVDETVAIVVQVLAGLGYAHARGLVHRDVKPQNIMLRPDGTAKVTDFGIAKGLSDATLTEAGIGMGTVHYLSPEQARGEPASPASDLYAVGVLLYEALTGALPFTGDSAVGVAFKHVHETPAPPDRLNRAVPPPLAALTLHALEKDPGARFTSAREMAVALQHWRDWPVGGGALTRRGTVAGTRTLVPAGAAAGALAAPAATLIAPTPHRTAPPTTTRARRDSSGCVTWLVGAVVLAGLLGLLLAGYQLTESQGLAGVPRPTSTAARQAASSPVAPLNVASMPPATPTNAPTATTPPTVARAASPATPLPSPTPAPAPTVTPPPSPTVMPSPTVTPSPLPTATPQPTATPSPTTAPTPRPTPTSTPLPTPLPPTATPLPTATPAPTATATPRPPPPTPTIALVPVPDFAELTLAQARAAAARVGLEVEQVGEENSASVARGLVISQDPPGGERVTPGGTITVVVSRGPLTVAVPNVRGRPYEAAKAQLEGAGFEVVREDAPSSTVAAGAVIDQTPAPGRSVAPGTAVLLTVSRGDLVRAPDVTGLDYREAGARLTAAGFTVSYNPQTRQQLQRENPAFSAANPNLRDGQVISQSLAPGGAYERGAAINIAYFRR